MKRVGKLELEGACTGFYGTTGGRREAPNAQGGKEGRNDKRNGRDGPLGKHGWKASLDWNREGRGGENTA